MNTVFWLGIGFSFVTNTVFVWQLHEFVGEGNGNPLQYPCLENLMDKSHATLVGCSPSDRKELGTTEQLTN